MSGKKKTKEQIRRRDGEVMRVAPLTREEVERMLGKDAAAGKTGKPETKKEK